MSDPLANFHDLALRYRGDAASLLRALLLATRRAEAGPCSPAELHERFRLALRSNAGAGGGALRGASADLHALLNQPFAAYSEAHLDQALAELQAGALLNTGP